MYAPDGGNTIITGIIVIGILSGAMLFLVAESELSIGMRLFALVLIACFALAGSWLSWRFLRPGAATYSSATPDTPPRVPPPSQCCPCPVTDTRPQGGGSP